MWKSILTALIAGIAVQQSAFAQGVSTADVNIVSVNGAVSARDFTCTVVINNQNDDDARRVRVIVLMVGLRQRKGSRMIRKTSLVLLGAAAGVAVTLAATQPRIAFLGASAKAAAADT